MRHWEYGSREGEQERPEGAVMYMVLLALQTEPPPLPAPLQGPLLVLTSQYAL